MVQVTNLKQCHLPFEVEDLLRKFYVFNGHVKLLRGILEFLDLWCSETSEPLVDVMKKKIHLSSVQNRCWVLTIVKATGVGRFFPGLHSQVLKGPAKSDKC